MSFPAQAQHSRDFHITPSIDILNFPHPVDAGLELTFAKSFGIKARKSLEPEFNEDGSKAEFDNKSIGVRAYPTQGSFFFGVTYGQHQVEARRSEEINGFDTNIYAKAKSEYITPSLGWKIITKSGFTVGFELGWIIAYNGQASVSTNQDNNPLVAGDDEFQDKRDDAQDLAKKYADKGLPSIGLLELGWTF